MFDFSIALSFFNSLVNDDIASVIFDMSLRVKLFEPPPELIVADAYPEAATSYLVLFNSSMSLSISDIR